MKTARRVRPVKSLGQNFLVDDSVAERIADAAGLTPDSQVLEIGPGLGALTSFLAEKAGFVTAIEIDKNLQEVLSENLPGITNYELIIGDAMKTEFATLRKPQYSEFKLAANLPYNITSPLLAKIIESGLFDSIVVMVQREFAERAAAAPGSSAYGAFSVFTDYHTKCERLFDVPPAAFFPSPAVTSSVIRFTPKKAPPCEIADEKLFFRTVRLSFEQRRKTLANALNAGFPEIGKPEIIEIIKKCGHDELIRGERLGVAEFAAIAAEIGLLTGRH